MERVLFDFDALSTILGEDKWFFGQKSPTTVDCIVASFLAATVVAPVESELKRRCKAPAATAALDNLVKHCARFGKLIFPEYEQEWREALS